jgi:hypothetical protein
VYSAGDEQELNASVSRAHSKLEPASLEENLKSAVVFAVGSAGPESIVVSGGRSIVQAWVAGLWSVLPAASVARTAKVCSPSRRSV